MTAPPAIRSGRRRDLLRPPGPMGRRSGSGAWSSALDRLACAGSGGRVVDVQPSPASVPLVTVVVPCYNYGRYLPACVGTIVEQPGVAVDILIVDDASTDGSGEVADELAAAIGCVRVIRHARNAGHIATYNDGLAEAKGEYVVLLSADDLLTHGSLGRATALMETYPSVGMVYGHAVRFSGAPPSAARTHPTHWVIWTGQEWIAQRFRLGRNCILSPEVVLRTAVQRQIGGYRAELPHTGDLDMWMRAGAMADIGFVGGVDQAWYREHSANMHSVAFQAEQSAGMAIDLRGRMRAFELVASEIQGPAGENARLLMCARRALAIEALTLAIRSHYWGLAASWPVDELANLAVEMYPGTKRLRHWRTLALHQRIGARRRWDPVAQGHEVALKALFATRRWRWARAGI
jgi:Glycosyl transferase family 2